QENDAHELVVVVEGRGTVPIRFPPVNPRPDSPPTELSMRKAATRPRNAFYAQPGGVTPVIHASAAGVIDAARKHRRHSGKVLAGRHGIVGGLTEELIDVSAESAATLRGLRHTPAGGFG